MDAVDSTVLGRTLDKLVNIAQAGKLLGTYTEDMGKTMDFISSKLTTNPNLPLKRAEEVDRKRKGFADQVELTLAFEKSHTEPLNQVLYQINSEGKKYLEEATKRTIDNQDSTYHSKRIDALFFDCGDGRGCPQ